MAESPLFFIVPFAIAAVFPGPAQGVLIARAVSHGGTSGLPFVMGMVTGNLIWLAAAMFGLSAVALRYELLLVRFCDAVLQTRLAAARYWRLLVCATLQGIRQTFSAVRFLIR